MSQAEKLKQAFLDAKSTFPWGDFERLLMALGYMPQKSGRTSGSARSYRNETSGHVIRLHAPHEKDMSGGMIRRLRSELVDRGVL
jgi:hypothetical protein